MNRRKSRETAFFILFEKIFNSSRIDDIIETARLVRDIEVDDFTLKIVNGVLNNIESIDQKISGHSKNWKKDRISKVSLVLLRIAIFEMKFSSDNVPVSVAINEAVELSKKYSTEEDTSFINGVLGGVARENE